MGDVGGEGVDGADVESAGVLEEIPGQLGVFGEDGQGEWAGFAVEGFCGLFAPTRVVELLPDALAHLAGGLASKGNGEDLGGMVDVFQGKELEKALDEETGFTGAGRGFDEPGAAGVKGLSACVGVWDLGRCDLGDESGGRCGRGRLWFRFEEREGLLGVGRNEDSLALPRRLELLVRNPQILTQRLLLVL